MFELVALHVGKNASVAPYFTEPTPIDATVVSLQTMHADGIVGVSGKLLMYVDPAVLAVVALPVTLMYTDHTTRLPTFE
jgi:hypothetical protein